MDQGERLKIRHPGNGMKDQVVRHGLARNDGRQGNTCPFPNEVEYCRYFGAIGNDAQPQSCMGERIADLFEKTTARTAFQQDERDVGQLEPRQGGPCFPSRIVGAAWRPAILLAAPLGLISAVGFAAMFVPHPTVPFAGMEEGLVPVDPAKAQKNWEAYGNTNGGSRFVALDQITRDNVHGLKVAWTYRTGDVAVSDGNGAENRDTPFQIGNALYLHTA